MASLANQEIVTGGHVYSWLGGSPHLNIPAVRTGVHVLEDAIQSGISGPWLIEKGDEVQLLGVMVHRCSTLRTGHRTHPLLTLDWYGKRGFTLANRHVLSSIPQHVGHPDQLIEEFLYPTDKGLIEQGSPAVENGLHI
jgi:hypothetical protein